VKKSVTHPFFNCVNIFICAEDVAHVVESMPAIQTPVLSIYINVCLCIYIYIALLQWWSVKRPSSL
jgi:hypothetical protein